MPVSGHPDCTCICHKEDVFAHCFDIGCCHQCPLCDTWWFATEGHDCHIDPNSPEARRKRKGKPRHKKKDEKDE